MRRLRQILMVGLFASGAAAIAGCGSGPASSRQPALYPQPQPPKQADADPRTAGINGTGQSDPDAPPDAMELQRLLSRLDALETDNQQLKKQLSDQYMDAVRQRQEQLAKQKEEQATGVNRPVSHPVTPTGTAGTGAGSNPAQQPEADLDSASQQALLDALVARIVDGKDPAKTKALMVAALSVTSPRHELDPSLLEQLDPRSREQVARFHQMLAVAYDELAGDDKRTLTRREMIEQIDQVFGAQPLAIQALELCRRVDSYGVYEPFAASRFLSGRQNRVLVYVELENFHHEPTEDGQFTVKLEQSIELYDATGETTVWRQGPIELSDVSRNKRRDFFIVYPVDLPARLTAGGYRLKVRIADKHTGSICEKTLHDIQIVADQALVDGVK